ncbi:VOC family protein, partial [Saccharothrix sp. MB29]|nr:VOC family protein [Saccharothrix sp. MB29]
VARARFRANATDRDQDAGPERLEALGARREDIGRGEVTRYVLGAPEGNEFCLLSRRVEP